VSIGHIFNTEFSMSGATEVSRRRISFSAFKRARYFVFVVVYLEKTVSETYVVLKGSKSSLTFEFNIAWSSPN